MLKLHISWGHSDFCICLVLMVDLQCHFVTVKNCNFFFLACCHLFHHEYFFFLSTIATTSLSFETLPFRTRIHCCRTFFVFIAYNVSNFVSNWKENCINLYYEEVIECDRKCSIHKTTAARKYWPQTKSMHSKSMLNDTHFHMFWSKIPKLLFIIDFILLCLDI